MRLETPSSSPLHFIEPLPFFFFFFALVSVILSCPSWDTLLNRRLKRRRSYKDASEHDRVLQWEQWCPCPRWRAARCDQLDDSIQVWRPVVESAWCELSSSPHAHAQEGGGSLYQAQSAQALLLTRVSASRAEPDLAEKRRSGCTPISGFVPLCSPIKLQDLKWLFMQ